MAVEEHICDRELVLNAIVFLTANCSYRREILSRIGTCLKTSEFSSFFSAFRRDGFFLVFREDQRGIGV